MNTATAQSELRGAACAVLYDPATDDSPATRSVSSRHQRHRVISTGRATSDRPASTAVAPSLSAADRYTKAAVMTQKLRGPCLPRPSRRSVTRAGSAFLLRTEGLGAESYSILMPLQLFSSPNRISFLWRLYAASNGADYTGYGGRGGGI